MDAETPGATAPNHVRTTPASRRSGDFPPAAWHSLPPDDVLGALGSARAGLSSAEAKSRLTRYGPNALPAPAGRSLLERLLAQFANVLIYVLLGAAAVTVLLGHLSDALVILAVVLVNAAIGFWQEGKAESALAAVRAMLAPEASVLRDGARRSVPTQTIVPGDVVLLDAGDRVPADIRLIDENALRIDEAALTGESVPADKGTAAVAAGLGIGDRTCLAYSGTLVTGGRGTGVVVGTGSETEIGRIGTMLEEVEGTKTPLLRQIDRFAARLTAVVLALCAAVFLYAWRVAGYGVGDAFLIVVGLAVSGIPEGLPAVISITLALGVQRMARRGAIVRRLPAIETLGAVSVVCSDKTGTLTRNEMVVRSVLPAGAGAPLAVGGEGYAPTGDVAGADEAARTLALVGLLCNDADLERREGGDWSVAGDPMDGALLALAGKLGLEAEESRRRHARLADVPFDSARRFAAVLAARPEGGRLIAVKGAASTVLDLCETQWAPGGPAPLDRARWEEAETRLAGSGQRVLGFAIRQGDDALTLDERPAGLSFVGVAGFVDPPREAAIAAVRLCRRAGMQVKMITGDHGLTALAVAEQLGMPTGGGVLSGPEIDALDDEALRLRARDVSVFARVSPEQKLRLVGALQADRQVVSMTGDGVNDAPALKRADVGVAMGIKGTEAAKGASPIVLADDDFATIAAAVREGRAVYDNIKKVIAWTLPTNGGEAVVIVGALLAGLALPITPVQILWINMVTAAALGTTLAFEPPDPRVMDRPPRRPGAGLVDARTVWQIALVSFLMGALVFATFGWSLGRGDAEPYARTLAVNAIVAVEIAYLFVVRLAPDQPWRQRFGTRAIWLGVAITVLAQAALTYLPPLRRVFGTAPLAAADLGVIGLGAAVSLLVLLAEAALRRRSVRRLSRRTGADGAPPT